MGKKSHKAKRKSKYADLEAKFDRLEGLVTCVLGNTPSSAPTPAQKNRLETNSKRDSDHDDGLSIFADESSLSDNDDLSDDNRNKSEVSETTKQCLFDMFGEDAIVKSKPVKEGIYLDDSQLKVLQKSFRCGKPNSLTAFNEESVEMFPVDESTET